MADRKISDLTALTAPAAGDYLPIVDISEAAAANKNKRITIEELFRGIPLGTAAAPSIAIEGDENTGIYSPGADQLAISTNGTGRLFVDSAGNVGVGTAAPRQALTFGGLVSTSTATPDCIDLGATYTSTSASTNLKLKLYIDSSGNTYGFTTNGNSELEYYAGTVSSPGKHVFITGGSERARIDSSGRLGLGTSAPQYLTHINSAKNTTSLFITTDSVSTAADYSQIGFGNNPSGNSIFAAIRHSYDNPGAGAAGALRFFTHTGSSLEERAVIDSSGRLGIGTTSPANGKLNVSSSTNQITLDTGDTATYGRLDIGHFANGTFIGTYAGSNSASDLIRFGTGGTERARIDSSGRLLVGTSTARDKFFQGGGAAQVQIEGANSFAAAEAITRNSNDADGPSLILSKARSTTYTAVQYLNGTNGDDKIGRISFQGADGTNLIPAAGIECYVDAAPGANDMPGRLVFSTTADGASSPTERMRINSAGNLLVGRTGTDGAALIQAPASSTVPSYGSATGVATAVTHFEFRNSNGLVGTISTSASATAYNTSSDYRLKENVVPLTGAIDRVNQLQVHRFNFIANPDKTVDGFIAHEAQEVVPECVTGEKDAVDDEGNPIYQGIDQSKLVPLLTAALQEALAEIASLKDRVAALEAS